MKRLIIKITLISFLCSTTSFGNCEKDVTALNKGEIAPCKGYLFSPEKEKEMYLINEDYKLLKKQIELKDLMIHNLESDVKVSEDIIKKRTEQSNLWEKKAIDSTEKYISYNESRGTRDMLFILLGIGLTVLGGWAVGQVK